jgi:hypothetical protein
MKRLFIALFTISLLTSCGNDEIILPKSVGNFGKVLVVIDNSKWQGDLGKEIRQTFGKLQVGLPQPEKTLSTSQVAPRGFSSMFKTTRNVFILELADSTGIKTIYNRFSRPQTVVYASAPNEEALLNLVKERGNEVVETFRASDIRFLQNIFVTKRLDDSQYKTFQNLNISLTIPEEFRTVDDTGEFLWIRQHLKSGIARGAGNNNILVYSLPLQDDQSIMDGIIPMRDAIGEKYIPGAKEGMYMITEAAYTPYTIETKIKDNKVFETRGKWEVKNDFMAGPFLNYAIVDEKNDRLLVVEGFTYAPSVDKKNFVLELEAIAKSIVIN